jgi:hypothetical protein
MSKKEQQIYQFKITLEGIKPSIWRRIQVPKTYTFWELHVAIQDAMGWYDYHLHQFEAINPKTGESDIIGIPDQEGIDDILTLPSWKIHISSYFSFLNKQAQYLYDFGDHWDHTVLLEKILPEEEFGKEYPLCVAGERACPPEDCGSIRGYEKLLDIIERPQHAEYKSTMEWLAKNFDPEEFKLEDVCFDDPKERWIRAFQDPTL